MPNPENPEAVAAEMAERLREAQAAQMGHAPLGAPEEAAEAPLVEAPAVAVDGDDDDDLIDAFHLSRYRKTITAFALALGTWLIVTFSDGDGITTGEALGLIPVLGIPFGVFLVPNANRAKGA